MKPAICRSCQGGKKMPVDVKGESRVWFRPDGTDGRIVTVYTSHFATCPNADKHRKAG